MEVEAHDINTDTRLSVSALAAAERRKSDRSSLLQSILGQVIAEAPIRRRQRTVPLILGTQYPMRSVSWSEKNINRTETQNRGT